MRLLFDHNLSVRLVTRLADIFHDSNHVYSVQLDKATDIDVWLYALEEDYIIVTKDSDFVDLSQVRGAPPKVLWLRIGNCTTLDAEQLLRRHYAAIADFAETPLLRVLTLIR